MPSPAPNLGSIETLFLDAGNTLISMDFEWVAAELCACGVTCDAAAVRSAEAEARPAVSKYVSLCPDAGGQVHFEHYLACMLTALPGAGGRDEAVAAGLARAAAGRLKRPGEDFKLWSSILPGVPEALGAFRAMGLKLVVVSNSDGSVERALTELGLAPHLDAILDSAVVGYEKPDPRFFEHALEIAGANASSTLHVGDMYYQDVVGARRAGIAAVLLDPASVWEVDDCLRMKDLAELADCLRLIA
jgi:HAD superfamily hydrolase (TIGR01509 family)